MERKEPSELNQFSALRATLVFFGAHYDSTASAECQIRYSYDSTKLNEFKERRGKKGGPFKKKSKVNAYVFYKNLVSRFLLS